MGTAEAEAGIGTEILTLKEKRVIRRVVKNATPSELFDEISKLLNILKTTPKEKRTRFFMLNSLTIIGIFVSKEIEVSTDEETTEWDKGTFTKYKIAITQLWSEVMKWDNKTQEVHKKILQLLPEKVIKCLTNPLHTSDYLVSAFDFGGPLALHSLRGIFVLMTMYNMEVPDFYTKLYSLFHRQIFDRKFQDDFFGNLDIFLMSSHLPEKLVAAFVKKLARLSLTAPTPSILLICAFIKNLMVRHPGLVCMVNSKKAKRVKVDPFLPNEKEPMNSKAIESCLWEIKTLQSHIIPEVVTAAGFINKPIGKNEVPWIDFLDTTYQSMIEEQAESAISKNVSDTPSSVALPDKEMISRMKKLHKVTLEYLQKEKEKKAKMDTEYINSSL